MPRARLPLLVLVQADEEEAERGGLLRRSRRIRTQEGHLLLEGEEKERERF